MSRMNDAGAEHPRRRRHTSPRRRTRWRRQHGAIVPVAVVRAGQVDRGDVCSGLTVARRSPAQIAALLGAQFELIEGREERHRTPGGAEQAFAWAVLRRR